MCCVIDLPNWFHYSFCCSRPFNLWLPGPPSIIISNNAKQRKRRWQEIPSEIGLANNERHNGRISHDAEQSDSEQYGRLGSVIRLTAEDLSAVSSSVGASETHISADDHLALFLLPFPIICRLRSFIARCFRRRRWSLLRTVKAFVGFFWSDGGGGGRRCFRRVLSVAITTHLIGWTFPYYWWLFFLVRLWGGGVHGPERGTMAALYQINRHTKIWQRSPNLWPSGIWSAAPNFNERQFN